MDHCFRKLAWAGVLFGICVASLPAAERESVAPVLHGVSAKSAEVRALENDRLASLNRIRFASSSTEVKPDDKAVLDSLAACFGGASESVIELRGYADGAGTSAQNVALSTERAMTIARLLTERGVPSQRILILGVGEVGPNGPPLNPEHQRVDIRVFVQPADTDRFQTGAVASARK